MNTIQVLLDAYTVFTTNLDKVKNSFKKKPNIFSISSHLKIYDFIKLYDRTKIIEKGFNFRKK